MLDHAEKTRKTAIKAKAKLLNGDIEQAAREFPRADLSAGDIPHSSSSEGITGVSIV